MAKKVQGYILLEGGGVCCPVDKCGAICCKVQNIFSGEALPCSFLTDDLLCFFHKVGDYTCNPYCCALFPENQNDIDVVNKLEKEQGLEGRCQL